MFSITNPFNLTFLSQHQYITGFQVSEKLDISQKTFVDWKVLTVPERTKFITNLIFSLTEKQQILAEKATLEMGKPISQAISEVKKCISLCEYYIEAGSEYLKNKSIDGVATQTYVTYEPLGVILGVMPWNFPYWQVFRFAIPAILAGNTVVVKHASNVAGCAELLEELFLDAGFSTGVYQNLLIEGKQVESVIDNPIVKAVSLTGSEKAGASVASSAAGLIKKAVLELGGSNAFIVCADADLGEAVKTAVTARMQNTGQSCIAAKRFLVSSEVYDEFLQKFKKGVEELKVGDPMHEDTYIGPMARVDLAEEIEKQVNKSVAMGAKILIGGKRKDAFYDPTILIEVTPDMAAFREELFGPVAAVTKFETFEEAVKLSNDSKFGLGVSVLTRDIEGIKKKVHLFEEGAVFINEMVTSHPALPFGGVKTSGYGRELAENGLKEFVNVKTVYIK